MKHHVASSAISEIWKQLMESQPEEPEAGGNPPEFIHLRDTKFFLPGEKPIPDNTGVFVRIALGSVHGFSFGKLEFHSK